MFTRFYVTNFGKELMAKAVEGIKLEFSRVQIGSGALAEGADIEATTALVAPIKYTPISDLRANKERAYVSFQLTNSDMSSGFVFREIGLFAKDPDEGEILFAYANAGDDPENVPAPTESVVDYVMQLETVIDNDVEVTVNVDESLVFATRKELTEAIESVDIDHVKGAPKYHSSESNEYGLASATKYGHAKASTTTPKAPGTASAGFEEAGFARGDHVHPEQKNVTGNAGTATKLQTAKKIGNASFDGSADVSLNEMGAFPRVEYDGIVSKRGTVVHTDSKAGRAIGVVTTLEPKQEGSGEPSPNNIRPIIGYDKLKMEHMGKNLIPFPYYVGGAGGVVEFNGLTYTVNADGSVKVKGTATGNSYIRLCDTIDFGAAISPNGTNGTYVSSGNVRFQEDNKAVLLYFPSGSVVDGTYYPQIELGMVASSFEPYHGNTYAVQFGQTVYGGKMDWNAGKLVSEWAMVTLNGMETNWQQQPTNTDGKSRYAYALPGCIEQIDIGVNANALKCSHFALIPSGTTFSCVAGITVSQAYAHIYSNGDSLDNFKSYLAAQHAAGTPLQIAYKLAEPIEIQFEPRSIVALAGINTVYTDAGDMSVEFGHGDIEVIGAAKRKHEHSVLDLTDYIGRFKKSGSLVQAVCEGGSGITAVAKFEPIQTGSGDPYPAGGGVNLVNPTYNGGTVSGVTIAKNENGYYTLNGTCTADGVSVLVTLKLNPGTYTLSHHIAGGSCDNASTGVMQLVKSDTNTFLANTNMSKQSVSYTFEETTNVWVRLFVKNGATYSNFKVAAQLETGSTATPYAPYANIRPISGHTGAKLTKCGKNLLKLDSSASGIQGSVTFTANPDGTVTLSGTASNDIYRVLATDVSLPNGDYILNGCPTGVVDNNYLLYWAPTISSNKLDPGHGVQFTVDNQETYKVMVRIKEGTDVTGLVFKPMIRLATETDATYEPYQGDTVTANFGQTVYGGTLDWNTGVLTVEWTAIDGGSRNWSTYADGGVTVFLGDGNPAKIYGAFNIISSHYKTSKNMLVSQMGDMEIKGSQSSNAIFVRDTRYTDPTAFKAAMSGVQICYQLQKPITIQLTPQQMIEALDGLNIVYSDASNMEVTFGHDKFMRLLWNKIMVTE